MAKFRILSLDGGGSWALLQVMALQALYSENARGQEILKDFDLVAANSGGSITLGGLIENFTLRDLLTKFFLDQQKRNQIFTPIPFRESLEDKIYALVGAAPRYQTAAKLTALQNSLTTFGSCPMSELPPRIAHSAGRSPHFLITAFDYDWKRAVYFRSNRKSRAANSSPLPTPRSPRPFTPRRRRRPVFRQSRRVRRPALLGRRSRGPQQSAARRGHRGAGGRNGAGGHRGAVDRHWLGAASRRWAGRRGRPQADPAPDRRRQHPRQSAGARRSDRRRSARRCDIRGLCRARPAPARPQSPRTGLVGPACADQSDDGASVRR